MWAVLDVLGMRQGVYKKGNPGLVLELVWLGFKLIQNHHIDDISSSVYHVHLVLLLKAPFLLHFAFSIPVPLCWMMYPGTCNSQTIIVFMCMCAALMHAKGESLLRVLRVVFQLKFLAVFFSDSSRDKTFKPC